MSVDRPRFIRPQELCAPDGIGGGGLPSTDQKPSSEGFDEIPFYRTLNLYHLKDARAAQRILSAGVGTGSDIKWLRELGKIRSPFTITGQDINEADLATARRSFASFADPAKGETITFVEGSAERLLVSDHSVQLITALNSVHLYGNPQEFFNQAALKLEKGGELFVNSTYVKDVAFPDPLADARAWGNIIVFARIDLKSQGLTDIPRPADPAKYTHQEYIDMIQRAGLVVSTAVLKVYVPRDEAKQLVAVAEFVAGAVPGIPETFAQRQRALQNAVDKTLDRSGASGFNRGWLLMHAVLP